MFVRWLQAVTTIGLVCASAIAHAQSFDCNKATTGVEHIVCQNETLRGLDASLALEFRRALSADPEHRQQFVSRERRWVAYRDRR
jgi:uncharacterized protein